MSKTLESIHADDGIDRRVTAYYTDGSTLTVGWVIKGPDARAGFAPSARPTPLLSADHLRDLADIVDEENAPR